MNAETAKIVARIKGSEAWKNSRKLPRVEKLALAEALHIAASEIAEMAGNREPVIKLKLPRSRRYRLN
jgi:hypothetical protein